MQCRCELSSPDLTPLLYSLFHRFTQNRCSLLSFHRERDSSSAEKWEKRRTTKHTKHNIKINFSAGDSNFSQEVLLLFDFLSSRRSRRKTFSFRALSSNMSRASNMTRKSWSCERRRREINEKRKKENWGIFETRADSSVAHICSLCKLHCGGRDGKEAIKSQWKRPKIKTLDIELNYKLRLTTGFSELSVARYSCFSVIFCPTTPRKLLFILYLRNRIETNHNNYDESRVFNFFFTPINRIVSCNLQSSTLRFKYVHSLHFYNHLQLLQVSRYKLSWSKKLFTKK